MLSVISNYFSKGEASSSSSSVGDFTITSSDTNITKSFSNEASRDNFLRLFYLEKLDDFIGTNYDNFALRETIGEDKFDISRLSRGLLLSDLLTILSLLSLSPLWTVN